MRTSKLLVWAILSFAPCAALAQLNVVAWYHLGEADPGAAQGGPGADPTVDSAGGSDLPKFGVPTYSLLRPPVSNIAMDFVSATADGYRNAAVISGATDNFGLEAWVYSTSIAGASMIAYNGHSGLAGWGLVRLGNIYTYLYGGVVFGPPVPMQLNRWTHLAVVRDNGITTFYVDGRNMGSAPVGPNPPAGAMAIGMNPTNAFDNHDGAIDEVRVFTFAPGTFRPALLLLPGPAGVPTLDAYARVVMALSMMTVGFLYLRRRREEVRVKSKG